MDRKDRKAHARLASEFPGVPLQKHPKAPVETLAKFLGLGGVVLRDDRAAGFVPKELAVLSVLELALLLPQLIDDRLADVSGELPVGIAEDAAGAERRGAQGDLVLPATLLRGAVDPPELGPGAVSREAEHVERQRMSEPLELLAPLEQADQLGRDDDSLVEQLHRFELESGRELLTGEQVQRHAPLGPADG